jgi:integrase/recombinase XerC
MSESNHGGNTMMMQQYRNHLLSLGRAPGTVAHRVRHIELLGYRHRDVLSVTTADLEAVLAEMRLTGKAQETMKAVNSSFRVFYGWAKRAGYIDENPAIDLGAIRVPVKVPRIAPDDVVQLSLITAELEHKAMVLLARLACLRLSEVATLHTSARRHDTLRILGKGEKERLIYINGDLMHVLLQYEQTLGGGFYFPGRWGSHKHSQSVNKIITRVTGCNPHSLRHAGATAMYRATRDLRSVQAMLGHASMATTQRYLHLDEEAMRAVAAGAAFRTPPTTRPNGFPVVQLRERQVHTFDAAA